MSRLKKLRQQKADLVKEADVLSAKEDDGSITDDEAARLEAITAEGGDLDKVNGQIAREERLADERRNMEPARGENEDTETERSARVEPQPKAEQPKFKTFGEQLQAVAQAGYNHNKTSDNRLTWKNFNAAATGSSEGVPSDGGFLVQTDFVSTLERRIYENGALMGRVRRVPISANANGLKINAVDETSRADGSRFGGVRAYWAAEADEFTGSRPKFRQMSLDLKKLTALHYTTDELLADAAALEAISTVAFSDEMAFKVEDAIYRGDGAGKPLGILNSPALVTVSKETGQAAATILYDNVLKMWARMWARSRQNAAWLINQDIEPQLYALNQVIGTGGVPVYLPAGGVSGSPFSTLFGRPVIPVEYCSTLGTVGDIALVDLSQYLLIDKGGVQADSSMHVRFVQDEMVFRYIYRVDGQPTWNQPLTPFKGSNTLSPFVALATRS